MVTVKMGEGDGDVRDNLYPNAWKEGKCPGINVEGGGGEGGLFLSHVKT